MKPLLDHINKSAEHYKREQEIKQREWEQKEQNEERVRRDVESRYLSEIHGLKEKIGNKEHYVYKGTGISDVFYITRPKDWSIWTESWGSSGGVANQGYYGSATYYKFHDRKTEYTEEIRKEKFRLFSRDETVFLGYYFPEWNIYIKNELLLEIYDYQYLNDSLRCHKDGFGAHPFNSDALRNNENKRSLRNIIERYKKYGYWWLC
ncbi:MAG: hypothetical protein QMD85_01740 [Candidatus Aenigmarchaeota archaeon]|nr:hypothetical protein [Candidatus Aenigmarchaeota archaeon]MDI6722275.1 hypothetical protein [Candidatus Aenigmarchaeota archaeon]